ncbi:uncharacterized protein V1510DRAFT_414147, partial [Dipodascopsis tothii]|uniref:uncharacterized protein n=1 Tax=Dipodascopsis tothii TaxID=44089 RepID=UPI0034D0047C
MAPPLPQGLPGLAPGMGVPGGLPSGLPPMATPGMPLRMPYPGAVGPGMLPDGLASPYGPGVQYAPSPQTHQSELGMIDHGGSLPPPHAPLILPPDGPFVVNLAEHLPPQEDGTTPMALPPLPEHAEDAPATGGLDGLSGMGYGHNYAAAAPRQD